MRLSILYTILVFAIAAVLINTVIEPPSFDTLSDQATFELNSNQPELAEQTLFQIVQRDRHNIENHYKYISVHFFIPEKKSVGKDRYEYRDDETIQKYYNSLAESTDEILSDIGHYGKGLIAVQFENYPGAVKQFQAVRNEQLKYLNNSLGNAYLQLDSTEKAQKHFRKEIEQDGNLSGAYYNLIRLLFDQGETDEINLLLSNKETKKYFPESVERAIYFKKSQPINYGILLFKRISSGFNIWGFLAAFLIMGSWIMYLRKIDVFEVERWRHIIIVVGLGMLFSFLTFPLSDFNNHVLGFRLNGEVINDFLYCVIGIGAIEEFVKIIPLLLILRFTKIVNEPFDYILYASLSALGFAFVENLIYFSEHELHIIHGRALTAVVSHMFDSSIIAYGLILNKYKRRRNPYLNFIFFFILASIAHGFYDFWLINESVSSFKIFTILLLLISIYMWNSFKNNALNQSAFYDKDILINGKKLQDYLVYSLSGVLLFEYVALALKYSPDVANAGFFASIFSGTYLILFLSGNLSRFNLNKGEWAPLKYWGSKEEINHERIVGSDIKLNRFTKNALAHGYLPNSGKIIKRMVVSKEVDWYLIALDEPVKSNTYYLSDKVIVRTKEKDEQIEIGKSTFIAFYLIPHSANIESDVIRRTDFKFCGWAKVE